MADTAEAPSSLPRIPNGVVGLLSSVLSDAFTHQQLDTLFQIAGAPGDPPEGSKSVKVAVWLRRVNAEASGRCLSILGQVIEEFMDVPILASSRWGDVAGDLQVARSKQQAQLRALLQRSSLEYSHGGKVLHRGSSVLTRQLGDLIRDRDMPSLEAEFSRATSDSSAHPREALSAAANILEAVLGEIIEELKLQAPNDRTLRNLWKPVKAALRLEPSMMPDDDLKTVVGAMGATVEGLSGLRNDKSVAHAQRPELARNYNIKPRHARLAINAAYGLTVFLMETLDERRSPTV